MITVGTFTYRVFDSCYDGCCSQKKHNHSVPGEQTAEGRIYKGNTGTGR